MINKRLLKNIQIISYIITCIGLFCTIIISIFWGRLILNSRFKINSFESAYYMQTYYAYTGRRDRFYWDVIDTNKKSFYQVFLDVDNKGFASWYSNWDSNEIDTNKTQYLWKTYIVKSDILAEEIKTLKNDVNNFKDLVLNDPEKILTITLLKKDIDNLEKAYKSLKDDINNMASLYKWFISALITIILGIFSIFITVIIKK